MKSINIKGQNLPKGGGAVKGIGESFSANTFHGNSSLNIPVFVSKGRGFDPSLSLVYSSGQGNGTFGIGFDISISSIQLKTDLGQPLYDDSDIPLLDGSELITKAELINDQWETQHPVYNDSSDYLITAYMLRHEGAFSKIEKWKHLKSDESFWKITTRDNVTKVYGKTSSTKIINPENSSQIFSWFIELEYDAHGNCIYYDYIEDKLKANPNKYIQKIKYGNVSLFDFSKFNWNVDPKYFHFEVVFDYGKYDFDNPVYEDYEDINQKLEQRADSFSAFTSGFEISTSLLCNAIHMFHRFQDEFGDTPALVHTTCFKYNQTAVLSYLLEAKSVGFKLDDDKNYEYRALPSICLSYSSTEVSYCGRLPYEYIQYFKATTVDKFLSSAFSEIYLYVPKGTVINEIAADKKWSVMSGSKQYDIIVEHGMCNVYDPSIKNVFQELKTSDGGSILDLNTDGYQLVDLYGEGLSGILYNQNETLQFQRSGGNGVYEKLEDVQEFPIERELSQGIYSLESLNNDGCFDLVVNEPQRHGFYKNNYPEAWDGYQELGTSPTLLSSGNGTHIDVTGDSLSDLIQFSGDKVDVYPSLGTEGYGDIIVANKNNDLPVELTKTDSTWVLFADIFGDGRQHLVRITNGSLECWPNLGYGKFGKKRILNNAPFIEGGLNTNRLFFADVDGTGTADIIYIFHDRASIFLNESGNAFSTPKNVTLPSTFGSIDQIQFADILGNGTSCLVYTDYVHSNQPKIYYYPLCGKTKPHLLTDVNNSCGNTTKISYASSVKYYLEDKKKGNPWLTKLPFPVQVVKQVDTYDFIAHSKLTSKYAYHNGYYDPIERQFRGFGFVEHWDSQTYEDFLEGISTDFGKGKLSQEQFQSPTYTKTWYNTGLFKNYQEVLKAYQKDFFQGDKDAYDFPESSFNYNDKKITNEDKRQAFVCLEGSLIRTESYDMANLSCPHQVSQSNLDVKLLQPKVLKNRFASFFSHAQEEISYVYESDAKDPQVHHSFNLVVDDFANIKNSCSVYYKRRKAPSEFKYEQGANKLVLEDIDYINTTDPFYLLGVNAQKRSFELNGIAPDDKGYFTFHHLADGCKVAIKTIIPYNDPPNSTKKSARLISWERDYYWNETLTKILPLRGVSPQALQAYSCKTIAPISMINSVFSGNKKVDMLKLGYINQKDDKLYWWSPSDTLYYKKENFYQEYKSIDPLGNASSVVLDNYKLLPVKHINALNYETLVTNDYQFLKAVQVKNYNNITNEVLFDALGAVVATSIYGTENGKQKGDLPLDELNYQGASLPTILKNPKDFLQGATSYYFYDVDSWRQSTQPSYSIELLRDTHISELNPVVDEGQDLTTEDQTSNAKDSKPWWLALIHKHINIIVSLSKIVVNKLIGRKENTGIETDLPDISTEVEVVIEHEKTLKIKTIIQYFDGCQRSLEEKLLCSTKEGVSTWAVTGRVVYNNKGLPVQVFEPFYSDSYEYNEKQSEAGITYLKYYDAFDRLVKIDTPKGFFFKTVYKPWEVLQYDTNDTVKDSEYFKKNNGHLNVQDQDALDKAVKDYNTPDSTYYDNMARAFFEEKILVDAGDQSILKTYKKLNILGYEEASQDPRFYATSTFNFEYVRDMHGNTLQSNSVDEGTHNNIKDAIGNPRKTWDSRSFCVTIEYDELNRKTEVQVSGDDGRGLVLDNTVEKVFYGTLVNEASNAVGKVIATYDQAGFKQYLDYDIQGNPVEIHEQLLVNYETEPDWKNVAKIGDELTNLSGETSVVNQKFDVWKELIHKSNEVLLNDQPTAIGIMNHTAVYDEAGRLLSVGFQRNQDKLKEYVQQIEYNAKHQHLSIQFDNNVKTSFTYEQETSRLQQIRSKRKDIKSLQDISYTYDPVGNITWVEDKSIDVIFNGNQKIEPNTKYSYDSIYRLSSVQGRMQTGLYAKGSKIPDFAKCITPIPNPNDPSNSIKAYQRIYTYDTGNNVQQVKQTVTDGFTINYDIAKTSNRLDSVSFGGSTTSYDYDAHGNALNQQNLSVINWNYRDNISNVVLLERAKNSDKEFYTYDDTGNRRRKVTRKWQGTTWNYFEKIYFGDFEIRRIYTGDDISLANLKSEFISTSIGEKVALHQFWTKGKPNTDLASQDKYQLDNNIGSVSLQLNAAGEVLSYEEYYPYGQTSIVAGKSQREVTSKEYRYSGKEYDSFTGLYYYGMRYYNPFLRRWLCPDPAGTIDGLNLYAFVGNSPIIHKDNNGTCKTKNTTKSKKSNKKAKKETKKAVKRKHEELDDFDSDDDADFPGIESVDHDKPSLKHVSKKARTFKSALNHGKLDIDAQEILDATSSSGKGDKRTTVATFQVLDSKGTYRRFFTTNSSLPAPKARKAGHLLGYTPIRGIKAHAEVNKLLYTLKHARDLLYHSHGCDKEMCRMCEAIEKTILGSEVSFSGGKTRSWTDTYYHEGLKHIKNKNVRGVEELIGKIFLKTGHRKKQYSRKAKIPGIPSIV